MNASTVADVLLIVAAVVWVLARQVQVARVKPRLLVLAPLVLAFFGIRSLPASTWRVPADLALLAVSAALSLGWAYGAARPSKCGAMPTAPCGAKDQCSRWSCGAC